MKRHLEINQSYSESHHVNMVKLIKVQLTKVETSDLVPTLNKISYILSLSQTEGFAIIYKKKIVFISD